jgi:prepilin-type N-terminal cleavage/methylation domain-containing protein
MLLRRSTRPARTWFKTRTRKSAWFSAINRCGRRTMRDHETEGFVLLEIIIVIIIIGVLLA